MDKEAWWAEVHRVSESDMTEQLSMHTHRIIMRTQIYEIKEWEYCVNGERKPNCRRVISSFTVKLPYGKQ